MSASDIGMQVAEKGCMAAPLTVPHSSLFNNVPLHGLFQCRLAGVGEVGEHDIQGIEFEKIAVTANRRAGATIIAAGSGASGSSTINARLPTLAGTPEKSRGGDISSPSQVNRGGISPLCGKAVEVMVNVMWLPPCPVMPLSGPVIRYPGR
jgi:hypothetical protein